MIACRVLRDRSVLPATNRLHFERRVCLLLASRHFVFKMYSFVLWLGNCRFCKILSWVSSHQDRLKVVLQNCSDQANLENRFGEYDVELLVLETRKTVFVCVSRNTCLLAHLFRSNCANAVLPRRLLLRWLSKLLCGWLQIGVENIQSCCWKWGQNWTTALGRFDLLSHDARRVLLP